MMNLHGCEFAPDGAWQAASRAAETSSRFAGVDEKVRTVHEASHISSFLNQRNWNRIFCFTLNAFA